MLLRNQTNIDRTGFWQFFKAQSNAIVPRFLKTTMATGKKRDLHDQDICRKSDIFLDIMEHYSLCCFIFYNRSISILYVVLFQVFSKTLTFQQTVLSIFCSFAKINSTYNVVMWWILLIQTERDIHNFSSKSKKNVLSKYRCFLKNICCIFLLVLN